MPRHSTISSIVRVLHMLASSVRRAYVIIKLDKRILFLRFATRSARNLLPRQSRLPFSLPNEFRYVAYPMS